VNVRIFPDTAVALEGNLAQLDKGKASADTATTSPTRLISFTFIEVIIRPCPAQRLRYTKDSLMPLPTAAPVKRPWILAIASGLLMAAAFPPLDLGFVAFFALIPLLIALKGQTPRGAFRLGLLAGFCFWATTFEWMTLFAVGKSGALGVFSGLVLDIVFGVFLGIWALGSSVVLNSQRIPEIAKPAVIASLLVLMDYIRQLGSVGIGMGELGYTQWHMRLFLSIAPLAGVWGITWALAALSAAYLTASARIYGPYTGLVFMMAVVGSAAAWGVHPSGQPYVAAALQANINQDVKWTNGRPTDPAYFDRTLATFADLTRQGAAKNAKLCVTAETSMPGYLDIDRDLAGRISAMARDNHVAILAGGRDYDVSSRADKNVIALFTGSFMDGSQSVAKQQLVPFGEFVPFQNLIGWISVLRVADFDMEAGSDRQAPIDAGPALGKIGTAICYDLTYPRCIRYQLRDGAGILAVGSDDTWFGTTSESRQSEAISAVRAAESDRYLVRASATGISAIIDNEGHVISDLPLFTRGIVTAQVQPMSGETVFIRFGNWWVGLCAIIVIAAAGVERHKENHPIKNEAKANEL
jgi:apolipoprotein N-acyltransferase